MILLNAQDVYELLKKATVVLCIAATGRLNFLDGVKTYDSSHVFAVLSITKVSEIWQSCRIKDHCKGPQKQ